VCCAHAWACARHAWQLAASACGAPACLPTPSGTVLAGSCFCAEGHPAASGHACAAARSSGLRAEPQAAAVLEVSDAHMQVSLPVVEVDGCPLGLGVMGPRGSDEDLLKLSAALMALLRPSRPEKS